MNKIIQTLARYKLYINRSLGYISIINSGMLMFMFLSTLENYGFEINLTLYSPLIFIGTIGLLILIGYLDIKIGFFNAEVSHASVKNGFMLEMSNNIKEIKEELKNDKGN